MLLRDVLAEHGQIFLKSEWGPMSDHWPFVLHFFHVEDLSLGTARYTLSLSNHVIHWNAAAILNHGERVINVYYYVDLSAYSMQTSHP
jgi:hypothetical protein